MRKYLILALIAAVAAGCSGRRVTMGRLLNEMTSKRAVTEHHGDEYRSLQQSSYDRSSVSPDSAGWFANWDGFGFIRTEQNGGRTEKVLFEDDGPGAITRIWLTTQDPEGTMRFYFDGSDTAGWVVPAYDLMQFGIAALGRGLLQPHTSYEAGVKGGSTLWLPIPYAKGCKVTLEEPAGMGRVPHYFHFNYRKYPEGRDVETMSISVVDKYAKKIARTDELLLHPESVPVRGKSVSAAGSIGKGDSLVVELPRGGRAVQQIVFDIDGFRAGDYEKLMRRLIFSARFDGKQTVWAPLADFSGGGMGAPAVESWYLSSDGNGRVVCRWPMPYRETATLTLRNISDFDCRASVTAATESYRWNDRSMYFHTTWKQERDLPFFNHAVQQNIWDWNFITISGRGVYRGDMLSLFNHSRAWYGEGDEKIWIDGDTTFPSQFGTGVEDYYNSSWAPVIPFHTPFGGAPRADLASSSGYNAFLRTRNLDEIPFNERMRLDMEMMGWVDGTVDYATTSYWYGDRDAFALKSSGADEALTDMPLPPPDPAKFKVAGAIEMEDLKFSRKSGSLTVDRQGMAEFTDGQWSRAAHLLAYGGKPGDYVEFVLGNLEDRPYFLSLYVTKAPDYGVITARINDFPAVTYDCYCEKVTVSEAIGLGRATPVNGRITLKIELTGKNPRSAGYVLGLDCITLSDK